MAFFSRTHKRRAATRTVLRQRHRRRRMVWMVGSGIGVIIVGVGVGLFAHWDAVHITSIEIDSPDVVPADEVEAVVRKQLAGFYGFIVPRSHSFVYPHDDIHTALTEQFPRIRTVTLDRRWFDRLHVAVTLHEPHAVWCPDTESDEQCMYVTRDGYIFEHAPDFGADVYFHYYGNPVAAEQPRDRYVLEPEVFRAVDTFRLGVEALGFEPTNVQIAQDGSMALMLNGGGVIVLNREAVMDDALSNIAHVIGDTETGMTPVSETRFQLEYFDVRFDDKVYYKMRENATSSDDE